MPHVLIRTKNDERSDNSGCGRLGLLDVLAAPANVRRVSPRWGRVTAPLADGL